MKASSFLALLLLARHSVLGEDQEGGVTSEACNEYAATSDGCAVGEVTTGVNLDYQCTYQGETNASSCMDDYCSGLVFGCNRCTNLGAENRWQTVSASTCTSLFAAGFRVEGEVGCATGSICAKFQIIEGQMSQLFSLVRPPHPVPNSCPARCANLPLQNQADVILEIVSALLAVSFIAANYAGMHGTSMLLNRVNVCVRERAAAAHKRHHSHVFAKRAAKASNRQRRTNTPPRAAKASNRQRRTNDFLSMRT
jgi:hypothetical protein